MSLSARPRIVGASAPPAWAEDDIVSGGRSLTPPREDDQMARLRETEQARSEGFERGRAEGERAEQARLRQALLTATEALEVLRESEERWAGAIEENIAALAVAIARHIVERELGTDAEVTRTMVRRALEAFPLDQPVRIRVNPHDLAVLGAFPEAGGTAPVGTPPRDAHWIGDPRVLPGGCLVEGRDRIVDGRVDTAIERVYRRLAYKDS